MPSFMTYQVFSSKLKIIIIRKQSENWFWPQLTETNKNQSGAVGNPYVLPLSRTHQVFSSKFDPPPPRESQVLRISS